MTKKPVGPDGLDYPDLEAVFLSGVMRNTGSYPMVAGMVTEIMFSVKFHGAVWRAFAYLWKNGSPIDPVMVSEYLINMGICGGESGGKKVLPQVQELYDRAFFDKMPVLAYAKSVKKAAAMRDLVYHCQTAIENAYESDDPDTVRANLMSGVMKISTAASDNMLTMAEISERFTEKLNEPMEKKQERIMDTGYKNVDAIMGGLPEASIHVICAYQKIGKSTISTQWMMYEAASTQTHGGIIFSLEMPSEMIYQRMIQIISGLPVKEILNGRHQPTHSEIDLMKKAREKIDAWPIFVVDQECDTVAGIRAHVHQFMAKYPHLDLKTIQVDHFHLLDRSGHRDEQAAMNKNVGELLRLTKETGVRILLPAQLRKPEVKKFGKKNEDQDKTPALPAPGLHDLRFASDLIDAAHTVVGIHRPNMYRHNGNGPEACELKLLASRDSSSSGHGIANLHYVKKRGAFFDNNSDSYWFLGRVKEYSSPNYRGA